MCCLVKNLFFFDMKENRLRGCGESIMETIRDSVENIIAFYIVCDIFLNKHLLHMYIGTWVGG